MKILFILALAFAVNIDCLLTGIAYAIQQIRLPLRSICIVSAIGGAVMLGAMLLGKAAGGMIPANFVDFLASMVLAFIGLYRIMCVVVKSVRRKVASDAVITSFRIPFLCIAVQILRTPSKADINADGTVDSRDAIMLGVALSLDVAAGGLAVALAGYPLLPSAAVTGLMSFCFLIGTRFFGMGLNKLSAKPLELLPGFILIGLALWRILF